MVSISLVLEQKEKETCRNSFMMVSSMHVASSEVGHKDACLDEGGMAPSVALTSMNFISTSSITSFTLGGTMHLSHDLDVISSSMSALSINPPANNVVCNIPSVCATSSEPLVSISDDSTSGSSYIAYGLMNREVISDPSLGLGNLMTLDKAKGGGASAKGRGRKSKMDHAKLKALFDQAAGTQCSITRALRASGPIEVVK